MSPLSARESRTRPLVAFGEKVRRRSSTPPPSVQAHCSNTQYALRKSAQNSICICPKIHEYAMHNAQTYSKELRIYTFECFNTHSSASNTQPENTQCKPYSAALAATPGCQARARATMVNGHSATWHRLHEHRRCCACGTSRHGVDRAASDHRLLTRRCGG